MKQPLYVACTLLLLSCFACMPDKPGAKLWFFVPDNTPTSDIVDSAIGAGSFLDLRPDGHFTRWFGHFEYGAWSLKDQRYEHCHFWEMYFKWAHKEITGTIDVRSTPTPMKIYGNGFGLKHYEDLSPEWKACFFDEEDCRKADTLIKHAFRKNNVKWPKTDNDIEKFISGFEQIQKWFR